MVCEDIFKSNKKTNHFGVLVFEVKREILPLMITSYSSSESTKFKDRYTLHMKREG